MKTSRFIEDQRILELVFNPLGECLQIGQQPCGMVQWTASGAILRCVLFSENASVAVFLLFRESIPEHIPQKLRSGSVVLPIDDTCALG